AWALRIARSPSRNLWSHMVGELARQNPDQAWQLAQNAANPAQRMKASSEVIKTLAAHDPGLAMTYLQKLPDANIRLGIASEVATEISLATPEAGIGWRDGLEDSKPRAAAAVYMWGSAAQRDVDAAARLVDRVPKEARRQWIQSVAMAYAMNDPVKGAEWLA